MARNDKAVAAADPDAPDDELVDDAAELDELRVENDELRARVEGLVDELFAAKAEAAASRPSGGAQFVMARGPSAQAMREQAVMARSEGARLDRIEQERQAVRPPTGTGVSLADTPVSAMAAGE